MTDTLSRQALQAELEAHYRWFHSNPEPSYREFDTTARLKEILAAEAVPTLTGSGLTTGLVAVIEGNRDQDQTTTGRSSQPTVAIRGDIDALPIRETTGLPYSSQRPGFMHGCGHDFNLTSVLGAALYLHRHRDDFCGRVKVLFQPAEEVGEDKATPAGAIYILNSGALDDIEAIVGIHDSSALPVGSFGISAGAVTGAVSKFCIQLHGQGSHAAFPHQGRSPIRAAVSLVGAIETITGHDIDPLSPCAVTVTHIEAGSTWNVVPDKACVEGTVRTLGNQARQAVHQRMAALVEGIATAYGLTVDLDWENGAPSVENDPQLAELARQVATEMGLPTTPAAPALVGEDFSYYQDRVPGLFLYAGVGSQAGPMHSPVFAPDVSCLADTSQFLANLALRMLQEKSSVGDDAGAGPSAGDER